MSGQSRVLMWTGIGLCAAGAVGLLVGGVWDVDAADPWASVAGGAAGLTGLALTIYALLGSSAAPGPDVTASGARSVAAGGSIGAVATGDGVSVTPRTTSASTTLSGGTVTASGDRSAAAGGDIGSVSTGDA
ncbi:hypothetical protein [Streptomyces sp. NPDC050982]|uniref:hypothetical protein n=1 Tax=Streptomyces sp. NPDC050982 TaxID=3154746 RepID=UPI00340D82C1